jgi:hypothetical protein
MGAAGVDWIDCVRIRDSLFVNVNRFSLHALYRNRLVRPFLGSARGRTREPDPFTVLSALISSKKCAMVGRPCRRIASLIP